MRLKGEPTSTCKCIRFPNDVYDGIEEAIRGKNMTLTKFVVDACRKALAELGKD